jgi:hypothetical protein
MILINTFDTYVKKVFVNLLPGPSKKLYHFLKSGSLFILGKIISLQLRVFNINVKTFALYYRKNLENQILPLLAHFSVHEFYLIFQAT